MKKRLQIIIAMMVATMTLLAGCTSDTMEEDTTGMEDEDMTDDMGMDDMGTDDLEGNMSSTNVKTGLGVTTRWEMGTEEDSKGTVKTVMAAVTVDENDTIIGCYVDVVESAPGTVDAIEAMASEVREEDPGTQDGVVEEIGEMDTSAFHTRKELGSNYVMDEETDLGMDWHEQAGNLEEYVVGMHVDEIRSIEIDEMGYATDENLMSLVGFRMDDFREVITKAVENAK